jgi:serine/threonine-protein kinase
LGSGYFGDVHECRDDWGNVLVAKVLRPRTSYEEVRDRWQRELNSLIALRHPNVTYVHDAFESNDTFYFIIERCSLTINDLISAPGHRGDIWLLDVARGLLKAISYIHRMGFVHKDIHGGNVFVNATKDALDDSKPPTICVKVGDLGIANLEPNIDVMNTILAQWMLPPEYFRPDLFGPRVSYHTDIYHAGLLLLGVLTGKFEQFDAASIVLGVPRQRAEALGPPFGSAIAAALRRHVHARHATAYDFWMALNGARP